MHHINDLISKMHIPYFKNQQSYIQAWQAIYDKNKDPNILLLLHHHNISEHYHFIYIELSKHFEKINVEVSKYILKIAIKKNVFDDSVIRSEYERIKDFVGVVLDDNVVYRMIRPKSIFLWDKEWVAKEEILVYKRVSGKSKHELMFDEWKKHNYEATNDYNVKIHYYTNVDNKENFNAIQYVKSKSNFCEKNTQSTYLQNISISEDHRKDKQNDKYKFLFMECNTKRYCRSQEFGGNDVYANVGSVNSVKQLIGEKMEKRANNGPNKYNSSRGLSNLPKNNLYVKKSNFYHAQTSINSPESTYNKKSMSLHFNMTDLMIEEEKENKRAVRKSEAEKFEKDIKHMFDTSILDDTENICNDHNVSIHANESYEHEKSIVENRILDTNEGNIFFDDCTKQKNTNDRNKTIQGELLLPKDTNVFIKTNEFRIQENADIKNGISHSFESHNREKFFDVENLNSKNFIYGDFTQENKKSGLNKKFIEDQDAKTQINKPFEKHSEIIIINVNEKNNLNDPLFANDKTKKFKCNNEQFESSVINDLYNENQGKEITDEKSLTKNVMGNTKNNRFINWIQFKGSVTISEYIEIGKFLYYIQNTLNENCFIIKKIANVENDCLTIKSNTKYVLKKIQEQENELFNYLEVILLPKIILYAKNENENFFMFEDQQYISFKKVLVLLIQEYAKIDEELIAYYFYQIYKIIHYLNKIEVQIESLNENSFLLNNKNELILIDYKILKGSCIKYAVLERLCNYGELDKYLYLKTFNSSQFEKLKNDLNTECIKELLLKQKMIILEKT
ncbi:hypothetical protein COBT_000814 [Conglomerata obtusa]